MQRFFAAPLLVATAIALWLATFLGAAWVIVWLIETFEGDMSECHVGQCATFGELLDDHDLLTAIVLALVAAVPGAALLWRTRARFTAAARRA